MRRDVFIFGAVMGLEEGGTAAGGAKKCPVDTSLARGRVHQLRSAGRQVCETQLIFFWSVFFYALMGLEEGGTAAAESLPLTREVDSPQAKTEGEKQKEKYSLPQSFAAQNPAPSSEGGLCIPPAMPVV